MEFAAGVYLSEAQTPYPSPAYTLYIYFIQYTYSHREGGEGNQREGERGNSEEHRSHSWVENTNMTECTQEIGYLQSTKSDKHLPQSPLTDQFC
jgi:hypothetical protein